MKTTDANSGNTPELTNEEYFEERKPLLAARQRGYQRADQMIVGGAAGALVLSITFLRNLGSAAGLLASEWLVGIVPLAVDLRERRLCCDSMRLARWTPPPWLRDHRGLRPTW